MTPHATRFATAILLTLLAATAAAEPVTTIRANGSPSNRVDIVVLGDGYTAAEIGAGLYAAHVENAITGLFAQAAVCRIPQLLQRPPR